MSEDVKKTLRTQGRYSDKSVKSRDKRQKESPVEKELSGKKSYSQKINSAGHQSKNGSFNDESENDSPVKYEENSKYSFSKLDDVKKPTEIKFTGLHKLSDTHNGISTILYEPCFIEEYEGNELFEKLLSTTEWNTKNIIIRGEEYPQPRLVAWYGPFPYSYSGVTLEPAEMPECVLLVKDRIEDFLKLKDINVTLNSVLLNYYRDNHDSVAWHSDDELTMGVCPTIASVSLGATRKFEMKRKVKSYDEEVSEDDVEQNFVNLTHGSLLVMNGSMQQDWLHRVPKEYHDKPTRINLTFRTVYSLDKNPSGTYAKDSKPSYAKKSSSERSPSSQVIFNDGDFPCLGDTLISSSGQANFDDSDIQSYDNDILISPSNVENPHEISPSHNTSISLYEDAVKPIEYLDDGNLNQPSNISLEEQIPFSSPVTNNLNDDAHYLKHDLQNKNIHSIDSLNYEKGIIHAGDNLVEDQSFDSNNSFGFNEPRNVSVDPFTDGLQKNMYANDIPIPNSNLNVEAQEFIPLSPVPVPDYSRYELEDFVDCYPDLRSGDLVGFTYALKDSLTDRIDEFLRYEQIEFRFLFSLLDEKIPETAIEKIRKRMCFILQRAYERYYDYQNPSYNSRARTGAPRQEYSENQRNVGHSGGSKRYSYKGERRTSQEGTYPNRRERPTSQEDTFSRERQNTKRDEYSYRERQYNRRDRQSNRSEGRSSRGDGSTNQGGRNRQ